MFNAKRFKEILEQYKSFVKSEDWKKNEKFKWIAVKEFQEHWDIDANNFAAMWEKATKETGPLLMSNHCYPLGVVQELARRDVERVKNIFSALFQNPDAPREEEYIRRVIQFRKDMEQFFKEDPNNKEKSTYQDERVISTYLWLKYPDTYGIYKWKEVKTAMEQLEYEDIVKQGKGRQTENLKKFLAFSEKLTTELRKDSELHTIMKERLTEDCYADEFLVTLTVDFIFFISRYLNQVSTKEDVDTAGVNYWFLSANPNYWSFSDMEVGEEVTFTFYNENGNKRRIFQNYLEAKEGDFVLAYESQPKKQIVAICQVSGVRKDEEIYFKKLREAEYPIEYNEMIQWKELAEMEFFNSARGSLFKLTKAEYDFLREKLERMEPEIRESSESYFEAPITKYNKQDFLKEVFMTEEEYNKLRGLLLNKKNIILQGAPGVGKTFAAKRLAYSIMGMKDEECLEIIQFHQNYGYEDLMMGYKPEGNGFELKNGIFYKFCKKAEEEPKKKFFFIIDEINRGNISKIFGELLMLIEADYRGESIKLAYREEAFSVPKNLYIIGMMNTADRSLAMMDYALRRRFSFYEMKPAFEQEKEAFYAEMQKIEEESEESGLLDLVGKIKELNEEIKEDNSLGKGFCIGHSYFCNLKEWLKQKEEESLAERLRQIVEYDIIPMLEEYWFDNTNKVEEWSEKLRGNFHDKR